MFERNKILYYALKYQGDWSSIARAIQRKESYQEVHYPLNYLTILDEAYPNSLKELRYPPWILFYKGDITLLKKEKISIIGSRDYCEYGRSSTEEVIQNLPSSYVIVSGLAKGIDAYAHQYAIQYGHSTIGVIGCGIDVIYPKQNAYLYKEMENQHLIISEYPGKVPPRKVHFPWRNRIIASLGKALIVTDAKIHSGTMLTVNEAISLSKDIYCIPYPYRVKNGEGCNLLISQGAFILNDISLIRAL